MPEPEAEDPTEQAPSDEEPRLEDEVRAEARRRGLGGLLNMLDSGARRGQDLVAEAARGSKEEFVRVISSEVRGFLDKMDVVDLAPGRSCPG